MPAKGHGPTGLRFPLVVGLTSELCGLIVVAYFGSEYLARSLNLTFDVTFLLALAAVFIIWFYHVTKLSKKR